MPLFSKLFARLPSVRGLPLARRPRNDLESGIGKTINDALAAAGLMPAATKAAHAQAAPAKVLRELERAAPEPSAVPGSFVEHSFTSEAGTRTYKLYLPAAYARGSEASYPLLVMLHGCTQSPDDFAAGTRMNALADQHGFLVAYPAQSPNANGSKCWNWFRPGDQGAAAGEPALLAGLTRQLIAQHAVDPQRVYVAGLSAGAAMAVILGTTHPELYAGVGAHSGLPYRAAHDVPSAFAAMGGAPGTGKVAAASAAHKRQNSDQPARVVPLIVFHGDADRTVAPANGAALVEQAARAAGAVKAHPEQSVAGNGRSCTRTLYTTPLGDPLVEYWQIHGAGHAWAGGSTQGTYTDPQGPDASAEMVRFFLQTTHHAA